MIELGEQMVNLKPGDHLCLFYEKDPVEQMPALVPFIREGLSKGEQFIYIADDQTSDELAGRLENGGIQVGHQCDRGALKLWTRREWRQPGKLSSRKKSQQVRQFIAQAKQNGFKGVRFAVEMTWTLGPEIAAPELEKWEATLNHIFESDFPGRIVCQYNRARLSPEVLMAALHTHPLAILGSEVYPNLFYQAPLILNGNGNGHASAAKVEWMISQLKRARAAEKQREESIRDGAVLQQARRAAEASQWLAAVVESSEDAIISKDLNGSIMSWNKGAERLFGYEAHEVIGKPITILIPPERQHEETGILERIRRGQRIEHYETVRRRKNGTLVEISLSVSPVEVEGRIIGASKIARDITERKRLENELREAHDQLGRANQELESKVQERTISLREAINQMEEFSYSVSHDLRAPVRAMQGYAEATMLDYGERLDEQGRDFLRRIIRGGSRMERLIQDLLIYCRLARKEIPLQPVSLDEMVREIVQQYPEMQAPRAEILVGVGLSSVIGHELSLSQVIFNLLSNAVKFVPPATIPKVQVWTERRGADVRLWIEDNGIGVKLEHQRRLFGIFERVHPDKQYEGTGIGLAIVRKAMERMGGRVGVDSDGVNGSKFWIELPATEEQSDFKAPLIEAHG